MNNGTQDTALRDYLRSYLSFSHSTEDAERLSRTLAEKYGSLAYIASSSTDELASTEGVSRSTALSLKLLGYVYSRSITDGFTLGRRHTDSEIEEYLKALFIGYTVETVYCLFLDGSGRIVASEYLGEGTVNTSEVYPRRVMERACALGARGVILAHNHPKGTVEPSLPDLRATGYLSHVLSTSGIKLIAHYLVNERECKKIDLELVVG